MRLPARDVAAQVATAVRSRRGREGLLRALPDVPAAVRRRKPVPPQVRADLRRLAG
jgi:hypothetical protein